MLRDRYAPMNLFAAIPTLCMRMDPVLTQMDRLLDDDVLFQAVKADLVKRFPATATDGRPSTPVEVHSPDAGGQASLWLELPPDRPRGQRQSGAAPVLSGVCRSGARPEHVASVGEAPPAGHAASPAGSSGPPGLSAQDAPRAVNCASTGPSSRPISTTPRTVRCCMTGCGC